MKKLSFLAFCLMAIFCQIPLAGFSQASVSGHVRSADGSPLSGASVVATEKKIGTSTNADGYFSLKVPAGARLRITYSGFESLDMPASANMDIKLVSNETLLDAVEVMVDKGYGKSKRLGVSSSIASVRGADIQNQAGYNMGTLLQGKATGVQVTNTSGGYPKILIRGFSTLNTSTDPLVILDGINLGRANLNLVNVNDIETIDILKDGAASAIYGSDASGGVIVITTKKGKAGKFQTGAEVTYGSEFYDDPAMAGAGEYIDLQKRRFQNFQTPSWATDTDWWKTAIKPTNIVNANINMSGGSDKLTAYASLGYYRTEGPYYYGHTQRATGRLNVDFKPSRFVHAGATMYPRWENWQGSGLGDLMPVMRTEPILPVFVSRSMQNEYSQYSATFIERNVNPIAALSRNQHNQNNLLALIGDVHVDVMPVKNLTLRTQIGLNAGNGYSRSYSPPFYNNAYGARDQNYDSIASNPNQTKDNYLYASRTYTGANNNMDWRWTNTANYEYRIGSKHTFNLLAGYESRKEMGGNTGAGRAYITVDQPGLWNPNNAGTPILSTSPNNFLNASGSRYNETWLSYFGRLNYSFDNKYFIEAAIRRDGSSRFPENKKYGTFPSVSGSWIVTNEGFADNWKTLNFLKFRVGYGTVGNASFNDPSVGLDLLSRRIVDYGGPDNYFVVGGTPSGILALARPGNPSLIWETTQDINAAIESYWFKNKLYFNLEWYNRRSKDLLFYDNAGRPDLGIRSGAWFNLGTMEVRGMEAVIGFRDKLSNGLNYDISVNMSRNKVFLNELGTNNAPLIGSPQGGYRISEDLGGYVAKVEKGGGVLGNFHGFRVKGVFQNWFEVNAHTDKAGNKIQPTAVPGDFKFEDVNLDGVINDLDKVVLGNAYPDVEVGLNIRLDYKGIDLAITGYGRFGHEVFWVGKKWFEMGSLGSNVLAGSVNKGWNGEGSTNIYPRFINDAQDANRNLKSSNSWFVEKGDYFRFNNIQLGYSLGRNALKTLHMQRLRVFMSLQNILTITSYNGLNPEIFNNDVGLLAPGFDLSQAPTRKAATVGISIGL